jgi:PAS domain S-box-containing protein
LAESSQTQLETQQVNPILFIAELEDITKSKKLEDDLRSSEERFRAISTSAMDAIILSDQEDRVIYWNPAAEKTFGFSESEAVGRKLRELVIPPHGQKKHEALLKELKQNQLSKRPFGFNALKKEGATFPMDLTITSVKLKDKNCLLSIVRDITEWKVMEEALRRERDMLEDITKNIGAGLVIIDKNYRVLWANNFLKRLDSDIKNKTCYSTFNTLDMVCPGCGPKKIFEGQPFDSREYFNKTLSDKDLPCWFELIATPIKDANGKVIAALELTVDITERKRLQHKLSEYSQKLEELVQKRTEQLKKTQAELVKSEKLAAIGELAGRLDTTYATL